MTLAPTAAVDRPALPVSHDGGLVAAVQGLTRGGTLDDDGLLALFASLGQLPLQVAAARVDGEPDEQRASPAVVDRSLVRRHRREQLKDAVALAGGLQARLRAHVRETTQERFGAVQRVLSRSLGGEPAELTAACAALACAAGGFDRAVLSRVDGSTWRPGPVHHAATGTDSPPSHTDLALGLFRAETDAVRRRSAACVASDRLAPGHPLEGGAQGYLVAPVVVDGRVVGLLHVDNAVTGRPLHRLDREVLVAFADGFARAYESAGLRLRLAQQREQVRRVLDVDTGERAAPVRLARRDDDGATVVAAAHEVREEGRLSVREHEILGLLATGATNVEIAERLFLSESTVKSHVKRILRKLPAANRAEAVYVYLRQQEAAATEVRQDGRSA